MNDRSDVNPPDLNPADGDRPDDGAPGSGPGWYSAAPAPAATVGAGARMLPPSGVLPDQVRAGRFAHPVPRRRLGVVAGGALGLGILLGGVGVGSYSLGTGSRAAAVIPGSSVSTTTTALSTSKTAVAALVGSISPAVVDIHATGSSSSSSFGSGLNPYAGSTASESAGTGMIVAADGYIVTNAHVIDGSSAITVTLHGQTSKRAATVVGIDRTDDIAVIKITATGLPTVRFGSSSAVAVGDPVITLGNALDLVQGDISVSTGIVSGLDRTISTEESTSMKGLLQTDAAISSGDSGGALVNAAGQVIGMNTAAAASSSGNEAENIGFAIPSTRLITVIRAAQAGRYPTDASTGSTGGATSGSSGTGGYGSSGGDGSSGGWSGFSN